MADADWRPNASRDTLVARAALLAQLRAFFAERAVLEVDTPALSRGVASEPHLDSLALACPPDRHLITSPEFALKRVLAAGSGPVYRLGYCYRGDEAGRWHNPEFCMLEWYRPGLEYHALMAEVQALLARVAPDWPALQRVTAASVFDRALGLDIHAADTATLRRAAQARGLAPVAAPEDAQVGARAFWVDLLLGFVVPEALASAPPTCVHDFPGETAGLTRVHAGVAQRFELYYRGVELANGGSEATDAAGVARRFESDRSARAALGATTEVGDARLLAAQRHGLPECAGVALGVDRLLALMLDRDGIETVLPFAWDRA